MQGHLPCFSISLKFLSVCNSRSMPTHTHTRTLLLAQMLLAAEKLP